MNTRRNIRKGNSRKRTKTNRRFSKKRRFTLKGGVNASGIKKAIDSARSQGKSQIKMIPKKTGGKEYTITLANMPSSLYRKNNGFQQIWTDGGSWINIKNFNVQAGDKIFQTQAQTDYSPAPTGARREPSRSMSDIEEEADEEKGGILLLGDEPAKKETASANKYVCVAPYERSNDSEVEGVDRAKVARSCKKGDLSMAHNDFKKTYPNLQNCVNECVK